MVKVLVADTNVDDVLQYSQYLSNHDQMIKTLTANTGIEALNSYNRMKADIMILNSGFNDMESTEIVKRLSVTNYERNKINIIITMNSKKEHFEFSDTDKIANVFYKPIQNSDLSKAIEKIKISQNCELLDEDYLNKILYSMHIKVGSYNTEILKDAIRECFDFPYLQDNLDLVLEKLSTKHNFPNTENIRSAIRNSLNTLNNKRFELQDHTIVKKFELDRNITPKAFLDVIVPYLHIQKKK